MNVKKTESKCTSPMRHLIIDDKGIGSNRVIIANHYLNNYNYFIKNNIKMSEIRKKQYLINKHRLERLKAEQLMQGIPYPSSFNNYNHNINIKINNDNKTERNKNTFKKAEINYSNGSFELKTDNNIKISLKTTTRAKIFDDLLINLNKKKCAKKRSEKNNCYKKSYSINSFNKEKKIIEHKDNELYNSSDGKNKKFTDDIKCKIIFGKNLASDYKKRLLFHHNEKNKSKDYLQKLKKIHKDHNNSRKMSNNITKYLNNINKVNKIYDKDKYNSDLKNISIIYKKGKQGNSDNNNESNENEQKQPSEEEKYYKTCLLPLIK